MCAGLPKQALLFMQEVRCAHLQCRPVSSTELGSECLHLRGLFMLLYFLLSQLPKSEVVGLCSWYQHYLIFMRTLYPASVGCLPTCNAHKLLPTRDLRLSLCF